MKMSAFAGRVLLLNASYEPLCTIGAARAVSQLRRGAALVEKEGTQFLRSEHYVFQIPSVIRLCRYRDIRGRGGALAPARSRQKLLARDHFRCGYCGEEGSSFTLTLDHIRPRAQNGRTTPENLVAACKPCNQRKGNRTPEEAGMLLLSDPRAMGDDLDTVYLLHLARRAFPEWLDYLLPFVNSARAEQVIRLRA